MVNVFADFEDTVKEIDLYFGFLDKLETRHAKLYFPGNSTRKVQRVDPDLVKILKANGFLLLYNLVEWSVQISLKSIYDELKLRRINFDNIRQTFKEIVLKNLKNANVKNVLQSMTQIAIDVISETFPYDNSISGNVDARKIKDLSEVYGFSAKVHKNARGGHRLLNIKTNRNALAHGEMTFVTCGRQYTITDLMDTKKETVIYVRGILKNIERYLQNQEYLQSVLATTPTAALPGVPSPP